MSTWELTVLSLSVEVVLYLLLVAFALRRGGWREGRTQITILYAAVSALWVGQQLAHLLGAYAGLGINVYLLARIPLYGLVLLALLFFYLTRTFLRQPGRPWGWTLLTGAWIAGLVLVDAAVLDLPGLLAGVLGWRPGAMALTFGAAMAGWGLFMAASIVLASRSFFQAELPLHRNRLTYWLVVWSLIAAGDLVFLSGQEFIGGDIRLLGTILAAYVVLTHGLPDVRQTLRRSVSYLVMTLLTVATYAGGFAGIHYLFQSLPGYDPILAGAAMALVVAILFAPLLAVIQKLVNRILAGASYDPSQTVSQYSLSISNIVDLERLATVAVGLLSEVIEIRRGALFVVNRQKTAEGEPVYELEGIRGMGQEEAPLGRLSNSSPVIQRLRDKHQPLTQYDVDLLPEFRYIAAAEREWLSALGMDVYVPIHTRDSWIGMLALGPKRSGDRYYDQDLVLLSTLADQTAVALENARLVDDLVRLNQDLQNTYLALAKANRQLQEMDRLKSAFIGVITHELRSPFANIAFSLQLFTRYGVGNLSAEQQEQLTQLTSSLKQARTMVDSLVTFATFLSKQGELNIGAVDFRQVIRDTLLPLRPMIETKSLSLHVTMPEKLPPVQADGERLGEAVHHLLHNAIKFTPAGGQVWIESRLSEGSLAFEVRDTGVGVPADRLPALWEGFTQMADPLQRGMEGLGLGLALVKYVVTAHGGQVRAESQEGIGSTFGFQIPLESSVQSAKV